MAQSKKTGSNGKKTATPAPTKAEDSVSPGPSGVPAAAAPDVETRKAFRVERVLAPGEVWPPVVSRMGNAPAGATPESHPHLFDEFGNRK